MVVELTSDEYLNFARGVELLLAAQACRRPVTDEAIGELATILSTIPSRVFGPSHYAGAVMALLQGPLQDQWCTILACLHVGPMSDPLKPGDEQVKTVAAHAYRAAPSMPLEEWVKAHAPTLVPFIDGSWDRENAQRIRDQCGWEE